LTSDIEKIINEIELPSRFEKLLAAPETTEVRRYEPRPEPKRSEAETIELRWYIEKIYEKCSLCLMDLMREILAVSERDFTLARVAFELPKLRAIMKETAKGTAEEDQAIGAVAAAERALLRADEGEMLYRLRAVGPWGQEVAEGYDLTYAAEALKRSMEGADGLPASADVRSKQGPLQGAIKPDRESDTIDINNRFARPHVRAP
jgi:hypothetical protein